MDERNVKLSASRDSRMLSTDSSDAELFDPDWHSCLESELEVEPAKFSTSDEFWVHFEMSLLGDRPQICSFIDRHADEDAKFWSAGLMSAVELEEEEVFKIFISHAPDRLLNLLYRATDEFGFTTLHKAVLNKKIGVAKLLVSGCQRFSTRVTLQSKSENEWIFEFLHARTLAGSTALHFATLKRDCEMVDYLAGVYDSLVSPRQMVFNFLDNFWMTPLHYAILGKSEKIVERLVHCRAYATHVNAGDWSMRTALHIACSCTNQPQVSDDPKLLRVIETLLESPLVDVNALDCCRFTPLQWAVFVRAVDVVRLILSKVGTRTIRTMEEDGDGRTVLHHAHGVSRSILSGLVVSSSLPKDTEFLKKGKDVERLLLTDPGLKDEVERLYRDRQVYVDAANAILVGAALIAGVTFGGWLQPPLGDGSDGTHGIVKVFWTYNSLSFFFAMASVLAGAGAVFPMANMYIGDVVNRVRDWLALTSFLLLISVISVLIAFGAAGFASLSVIPGLRTNMTVTTAFGSLVCGLIGLAFLRVIFLNRPEWLQFTHYMERILKAYNSFQIADIRNTKYDNSWRQWSTWKHFKGILRFAASSVWQMIKRRETKGRTELRGQAGYEEQWTEAFERVYQMLAVDVWPYLRSWRAIRRNFRSRLQAKVQEAFDRTYSNLELACQSRTSKNNQILQCINDDSPCGLRRATHRGLLSPASRRSSDINRCEIPEVLEEAVIQMVTARGGRGLLHLFLHLPTRSCREICLRNNMIEFEPLATAAGVLNTPLSRY